MSYISKFKNWNALFDMLRSSRKILNFNGIVTILLGLLFIIFPEELTLLTFPKTANNLDALEVGKISRTIIGIFSICLGLILFSARITIRSSAQKILLSSSLGFFFNFLYFFIYIHK